jgi:hypothetical protein
MANQIRRTLMLTAVLATACLAAGTLAAQQGQDAKPGTAPQVDLSGKWKFSAFGSNWNVDLKLDPKMSSPTEKVYCGEAAREQKEPDTPIIKSRLCAEIDPDDGQLHVEVSGSACQARWRNVGLLDGTCTRGGGSVMTMRGDDDPPGGSMVMPMGGFTALRVSGKDK